MPISLIETVLIPALRSSPGTFSDKMEALMVALPTWTSELNAIVNDINAATQMASTATAEKWVSGTTYADGDLRWSPTTRLLYRRKGAGGGTTDPASDTTNWQLEISPPMMLSERTSNSQLLFGDAGKYVKITSGTFTQTFAAAANLGAGWYCWYHNAGAGIVTIDPDGSETIDGVTSYNCYPGEVRLISCNGTSFQSIVVRGFSHTFTATGNFYMPPGYTHITVDGKGGGGGGSAGSTSYLGAGGGGGGRGIMTIAPPAVNSTTVVTIGAGGVGATIGGNAGSTGGTTSFGSIELASGGTGGQSSSSAHAQGGAGGGGLKSVAVASTAGGGWTAGGAVTNGDGTCAFFGGAAGGANGKVGGSSYYGGAGGGGGAAAGTRGGNTGSYTPGGGGNIGAAGADGTAPYCGQGGGGGYSSAQVGGAGGVPSGGGGGGLNGSYAGGNGGRGECTITGVT